MHKFLLVLSFILIAITNSFSQDLKSPSDFLGYDLGTQFSRHHQVIDYFKHVSQTLPNQVLLEQYGQTYERRPLYMTIISSEENIKNIDQIRENNLKNAGVIEGNSTSNNPAIIWLSYNVHGNEASSTEAAMKTLYTLITEKQDLLKNTVVIIDPCVNPDGRDRYVNWYNETSSMPYNTDQQASEHHEPWPGGRPNHYLFDLNRDWAWATQIESSSRLKVYNTWLPQIHVDFHEQGINNPYYFAPAAEPFHEIISEWQRHFQTEIGQNNAKYFDNNGWLYFTRERFDLLYPSYGDTYPTYMGAIGMTYEQAGHGRAGLGIMNDEATELTLKDRIAHHTTTGLSTIEMTSQNAEKLNLEFKKFFDNTDLKYKSYVMHGNSDKIEAVKHLLDKHDITYKYAAKGKVSGMMYGTGKEGKYEATEKDLIVSTNQPKGKMVTVLFEPDTKLNDSITYDITAWSIPYAYGLDAIASKQEVKTSITTKTPTLNTKDTLGVGYISAWNSLKDAEFLTALLQKNIKIRFNEKPFTTLKPELKYDRGSLIITRGDNKSISDFDDIIIETANLHKRKIQSIATGYSKSGTDLGSPDVKLIHKQKIAILSGKSTSSLSYGELWHFFEQQLHYPISSINTEHLHKTELDKYNVLIIPDGYYGDVLNENALKKLQTWIKKGGKLVAIDGSLKSLANKKGFALKTNKVKDTTKTKSNLVPYAEREREATNKLITGAIFKSKVDNTHPMAFGYDKSYLTLKLGNDSYSLLENGYNVAYLEEAPKPISGFAGKDALKELGNSLVFGEERIGKGSVIYMVDNPLFRSFWENGKLFMVNSVFFVNNNRFEL